MGGQGVCDRRIENFLGKFTKKNSGGGGGVGLGGGVRVDVNEELGGSGWGSQDGCERRIEVFVKIQKKNWRGVRWGGGSGWGGVRVYVIEELKSFWENSQKKFRGGCRFGGGGQGDFE